MGEPERQAFYGRAPCGRVRRQAGKRGRIGLAGNDPEVPGQPAGEHGEQSDIGTRIHDAVAVVDRDSVPQVRLQNEDLVIDIVRLVLVQMCHRRAVGQEMERLAAPQWLRRPFRHHVCDQLLTAGLLFAREHHGVPHTALRAERPFDFTGLDPVAVDLDLVVNPAAKLDIPVRQDTGDVAATIQASTRIRRERIGYESLGGLVRAVEVAPRHARAADAQLALFADWHGLAGAVEEIDAAVGQRSTQRERTGLRAGDLRADVIRQYSDGGLRGTVVVVDLAARRQGAEALNPVQPRGLATQNQATPGHDPFRILPGLQRRQM